MRLTIEVLKAALLVAAIVLCAKVFFVLDRQDKHVSAVLGEVRNELDGNNKASLMHIAKKSVIASKDVLDHTDQLVFMEKGFAADQNTKAMAVLDAGANFINDTNRNVNVTLIPDLTQSLKDSTANIQQVTTEAAVAIQHMDDGMTPVFKSALANSKNLEAITGDPEIHTSFQRLSFDLGEFGKMTTDGAATTADVRDRIHTLLHPKKQNFTTKVLWFMLGKTRDVAAVRTAFF